MKPPPFEYLAPGTLDEALAALAGRPGEARPLAGGQSLVPMLNFRLARPAVLVDLNRIEALSFVREARERPSARTRPGGGAGAASGGRDGRPLALRIGAMTRQRTLERHPQVAELAPLLAEAARWIAHPQIRARGTLGGSIAHADPAAELPAVLLALDAGVRLESVRGGRRLGIEELFHGPFLTALEPDELLVEIEIPTDARAAEGRVGTAFLEIARRRGDYALAGVAAHITLDADGVCRGARLGLVNAAPEPCLAKSAASVLIGETPSDALVRAAAERAAQDDARPAADLHASVAYRRHLVGVLVRRALATALERAGRA